MSKPDCSKLHIAMFPWVAYGHFIPFLHLSNKLAQKGHKISFLLPKGVQPRLENMNHFPDLIQFFPLLLPQVDGLPPGAETASVVPMNQQKYLAFSVDQTRDQVESIFKVLKPDVVFYDFWFWIPDLARQLGISPIFYSVVCSMGMGLGLNAKKLTRETTVEEAIELPPGYPSSTVRLKAEEAPSLLFVVEDFGSGLSFDERIRVGLIESDAIAFRTYREIEGPFLDYVAQGSGKPVLLSGPCLPGTETQQLDDKWVKLLSQFEPRSVVFCAFGSQSQLQKDEFQELVLGFELCGHPFLVALKPPKGCSSVEEALPEGFQDRVKGRGLVYDDWVPQQLLLQHPSIGCFVNHCGYGTMWEFLLSDCQIVLIPELTDQILNTRLMVNELNIGVEVERDKNRQVSKESLSEAVKFVMDKDNETANMFRANHAKLKETLSNKDLQEQYINNFIQALKDLVKRKS
ncbi:UDP-glycosyltransferase 79B6 [Hibiscus syriacus]|uniref:UDP-glycosyltransferase 79B6 n=1 Tax=Hibiscus syriacus TaxID=106335 RepID=A0A6A3AGT6_HIBSY|nr:UDP-glycosyltransferase 79B6-like [Hibiscus syriacus]KAE8703288.1 UDP-glycosyltransferase 79B6 [Hibiscus syriacus]